MNTINSCDDMPFSFSGCEPDYSRLHLHTIENRIQYIHPMNVSVLSGIDITKGQQKIAINEEEYTITTWTTEENSIWGDEEEEYNLFSQWSDEE